MTRVRVGIVSWNTADLLDRCLRALPAALDGVDADVVVVDNASGDDSAERAARHAGVTVVRNAENLGYSRAMNQALTHGHDGHDVLVALNPDTEPPPGGLAQLVAALMADASVGLVAPRLVHEGGQLQHSVYRFPSPRLTALICGTPLWVQRGAIARHWWLEGRVPHTRASDVDWAIGAVHVMRTAALPAQPPYGEHWFMYVEDLDLCWRLRQAGWRVRFDPAVEVVHTGNVAGAMAWGDTRTIRWWAATYDWYRRAHGVAAARRYARVNVTGVRFMLWRARVRRRLSNAAAEAALTAQVEEFRAILPIHQEMARQPDTAFAAEVRAAPSAL